MPPPPPDWTAVRTLFERALASAPGDRAALLDASGLAPEVAAEVRSLLAHTEADAGFLEQGALAQAEVQAGQRLGPWELVGPLGRGGMGEVWEARRADGAYDARVAVKLTRPGLDASGLMQRFGVEQRLLARLHHPHIARLLDAGQTGEGRPYFVLEAVDGQPIDEACQGLPLGERLRLLLQLADAVAHAHRMKLIHRDLKPANVLVTADGEVKLLDFGIARSAELPGVGDGGQGLTPGYASPEQVRGEPATAASDVYALGVLLFKLLTGRRPHGGPGASAQEVLRAVLQEPPPRPSDAAGEGGVAARELRGDLDAIALKALAHDPAQRYASVDALVRDLRAHLERRPVAARPATPWYVAGRFVARHQAAVAASGVALLAMGAGLGVAAWQARDALAALALLALAVGLGLSTWQARAAAAARDAAQRRLAQAHTLVRDIVMRYADTVTFVPGGLKMKADLLRDTLAHLEQLALAGDDPVLAGERAKALARLADLALEGLDATLADPDAAARDAEAALALFPKGESAHRDEHDYYLWWARAWRARVHSLRRAGQLDAALAAAESRSGMLRAALARFPTDAELRAELGSALLGQGQLLDTWQVAHMGRPERALEVLAAAAVPFEQLLAERPHDGDTLYQLGTVAGARQIVLHKLGRFAEAAAQGRAAVQWRERALALDPQHTAYRHGAAGEANNLTLSLLAAGWVEEALAVSARGEQLAQALVDDDPAHEPWRQSQRLFAMHRGRALLAAGQPAAARERLQLALQAMGDDRPATRRRRGWCRLELARAEQALGLDASASLALAAADLDAALAAQPEDAEARAWRLQAQALVQ